MRFLLRYWTRRSASTIALQSEVEPGKICAAAERLRSLAAQQGWTVYGEAFVRFSGPTDTVVHLPVGLEEATLEPPVSIGRIDHGPVVAAYEVPVPAAERVALALIAYVRAQESITGPIEYHFDPSVGRTEGIIVLPTSQHPADKAAYISIGDAVTG